MSWTPFDCLAVAELTRSGLLEKLEQEVECLWQTDVQLRSASGGTNADDWVPLNASNQIDERRQGAKFVDREEGLQLVLTTHRLVWFRTCPDKREGRYLHLSNIFSNTAETSYFKSPKISLMTSLGDVLLVFTSTKLRDECLERLQQCLTRQEWEKQSSKAKQTTTVSRRRVGVDAIVSASQQRHAHAAKLTNQALEGDSVESLFQEATSLVQVIQKYVATLDRNNTSKEDADGQDNQQLLSLLQDMGMASSTLTNNNNKKQSTDLYYDQMARQMADLIRPKLLRLQTQTGVAGGVMTLTDVFCYWNRARAGSASLVSPEDVWKTVQVCHEQQQLGLSLQTLETSGLKVLVLRDDHEHGPFSAQQQLVELCETLGGGGITYMTVARQLQVPSLWATEQLHRAEQAGVLVRDETLEGIRYFPNTYFV